MEAQNPFCLHRVKNSGLLTVRWIFLPSVVVCFFTPSGYQVRIIWPFERVLQSEGWCNLSFILKRKSNLTRIEISPGKIPQYILLS